MNHVKQLLEDAPQPDHIDVRQLSADFDAGKRIIVIGSNGQVRMVATRREAGEVFKGEPHISFVLRGLVGGQYVYWPLKSSPTSLYR